MNCSKCNAEIMKGSSFCPLCGTYVSSGMQPSIDPIKKNNQDSINPVVQKEPNNLPMIIGAAVVAIGLIVAGIGIGARSSKPEVITITEKETEYVYVTPVPTAKTTPTPELEPVPSRELFDEWMSIHDYTIKAPKSSSYLSSLQQGVIRSEYGAGVYAKAGPSPDSYKFYEMVKEGEEVTVMAVQGNYALIRVNNSGRVVWVGESLVDY